jgi:hypothetical protein
MSGVARGLGDDAPLTGRSVAVTSTFPWRRSAGTGKCNVPSASASKMALIVFTPVFYPPAAADTTDQSLGGRLLRALPKGRQWK